VTGRQVNKNPDTESLLVWTLVLDNATADVSRRMEGPHRFQENPAKHILCHPVQGPDVEHNVIPNTKLIKTLMLNGLDKATTTIVKTHRHKKTKN